MRAFQAADAMQTTCSFWEENAVKRLTTLCTLILLMATAGWSQTFIGGNITDLNWTMSGSPYQITSACTVQTGDLLNIGSGVQIQFDADVQFVVEGILKVNGMDYDSVRFVPGTSPQWNGLRLLGNQTQGIHTLDYVVLTGVVGNPGISVYGGGLDSTTVNINNSDIRFNNNTTGNPGGGVFAMGAVLNIYSTRIHHNSTTYHGGAIGLWNTRADISRSELYSNSAPTAGAIYINQQFGGASKLDMDQSFIYYNDATDNTGGAAVIQWTGGAGEEAANLMRLSDCLIAQNQGAYRGVIHVSVATAEIVHCTIADNQVALGGEAIHTYGTGAHVDINSSILWNNMWFDGAYVPDMDGIYINAGTVSVDYSDIQQLAAPYLGTGNINMDPMFKEFMDDYTLTPGSPAEDTGDPTSYLIRDDTGIPDMGARISTDGGGEPAPWWNFQIPNTQITEGPATTEVPVIGYFDNVQGVEIAFTWDSMWVDTANGFFAYNYFETIGWSWNITISDDSMCFAAAGATPISVNYDTLLKFNFDISQLEAPAGTWFQFDWEKNYIDEMNASTEDGWLNIDRLWGDATRDGAVTSYDASVILAHVVGQNTFPDFMRSDVTMNGRISAYDAGLILTKVLDPSFKFPAETEEPPVFRLASTTPRVVAMDRDATGWSVTVDDASGIVSGMMTFALPEGTSANVTGGQMIASNVNDGVLTVAFLRNPAEAALFHVEITGTPIISGAEFNEGLIPAKAIAPVSYALMQNAPNPFNPTTSISFTLPSESAVSLSIYNTTGQLVRTLSSGTFAAGTHTATWNARDNAGRSVASGVYLYRLASDHGTQMKRMVLVR
jgi:hypothetical protein